MNWQLSRFRTGDLVEIRSKEEILATLDADGCVDRMPFMPEMLQFCGQRLHVSAAAHKTCETAEGSCQGRRLHSTVHLDGVRCDGSAHGGCQADCNIFWKDLWLKSVNDTADSPSTATAVRLSSEICTESQLLTKTQQSLSQQGEDLRYSCQVTMLNNATEPLAWWDVRQYVYDVMTRNHSLGHVSSVLWLAFLRNTLQHTPFGYRLISAFRSKMHRWLLGREVPDIQGTIPRSEPTPTKRLDLKPGDQVRIKPKEDIAKTLNVINKNRGMYFDVEMSPYCGRIVNVRKSVTKIVDELTGKMLHMKQPCIILDGVVCNSEYSKCRLMCPRRIPSYWREVWLERVDGQQSFGNED